MTARPVTVGVCATAAPPAALSPDEARRWNLAEAERLVVVAAAEHAEIACLPETFATCGAARRLPLEPLPDGETARAPMRLT